MAETATTIIGRAGEAIKGTGISAADLTAIAVIGNIVQWLVNLAGALAMFALVWGGIMYILSLGDDSRTQKAKKIIFWAIVGLLVIGLSRAIILLVLNNFIGGGAASK